MFIFCDVLHETRQKTQTVYSTDWKSSFKKEQTYISAVTVIFQLRAVAKLFPFSVYTWFAKVHEITVTALTVSLLAFSLVTDLFVPVYLLICTSGESIYISFQVSIKRSFPLW